MSASAFMPTVLTISSGTGSGSGEKNNITNPSMASATTGWNVVGDFTLTRTTAASELPREYTTGTGIKLVATSGTQSTADYMYFDFNLDDVDLGKKLKIQWSQKKIGTYSAGQLAVVITSQADRTTALITPQTTAIPASDLDFVTSFDSTTTAALSLVIRATTDMTTGDGIVLSDVIVGPGEIVPGAAISEWQSFTPSYNNIGTATFANNIGWMRRVGSNLEISVSSKVNAAGSGSTQITLNLPNNLTVNWSAIAQVSGSGQPLAILGYGSYISTAYLHISVFARQDIGIIFGLEGSTANNITGADLVAGRNFDFTASIPVSEWASNGTVSLGAGAQQEFVYNTSGITTAGASNTTAFGYGPQGVAIGSIDSVTAGSDTSMRCRFQYPIQNDDMITLEVDAGTSGAQWIPIEAQISRITQSTSRYGATISITNSTDINVNFGNKGFAPTNISYAGDGATWASINTWKWRVRKAKASSPVGFGKADSTSFGLVGPRRGQYALTFSSTPGGWSLKRGVGIYYQDQDGNHRLQMNIIFTATGATSFTFTVDGVTFKDLGGGFQQALAVMCVGSAPYTGSAGVSSNSGTVNVYATSSSTDVRISGDVELQSKPTWA